MDFNELIHSERGKLIRQMPKGAEVVLSAGCAGAWYFKWFEENYGIVKKHIGLELYSEKPDNLPSNVEWIENSVDEMSDIESNSIDLLFSGQNIEHLSANVLLGFLQESNRVLKTNGYLIIDSPNRKVTQPNRYVQPEHTLELTDDEIVDLLKLAGFSIESLNGIWDCNFSNLNSYNSTAISVPAAKGDLNKRIKNAYENPSDSFIWWVVAKKKGAFNEKIEWKIEDIYLKDFPGFVRSRFSNQIGKLYSAGGTETLIATTESDYGYVLYGPYIPILPGKYVVFFRYKCLKKSGQVVFDVCSNQGEHIYAKTVIMEEFLPSKWDVVELSFDINHYVTGLETRVLVDHVEANFKFGSEIMMIG